MLGIGATAFLPSAGVFEEKNFLAKVDLHPESCTYYASSGLA
jgi:hypothetical protein